MSWNLFESLQSRKGRRRACHIDRVERTFPHPAGQKAWTKNEAFTGRKKGCWPFQSKMNYNGIVVRTWKGTKPVNHVSHAYGFSGCFSNKELAHPWSFSYSKISGVPTCVYIRILARTRLENHYDVSYSCKIWNVQYGIPIKDNLTGAELQCDKETILLLVLSLPKQKIKNFALCSVCIFQLSYRKFERSSKQFGLKAAHC